jgi:hypothetical protein
MVGISASPPSVNSDTEDERVEESDDDDDVDNDESAPSASASSSGSDESESDGDSERNHATGPNGRVRKFSESIRSELERQFAIRRYVSGEEKRKLAAKLSLTARQVQKWFVHRREKLRREQSETMLVVKEEPVRSSLSANDEADSVDSSSCVAVKGEIHVGGAGKRRRSFEPSLTSYLEKLFAEKQYLTPAQIEELSVRLSLKPKQIKAWFKNRRQRTKSDRKATAAKLSRKSSPLDAAQKRHTYPDEIVEKLESAFLRSNYISGFDKKMLAESLNLKPIQIERWFYYKRRKLSE